MVQFQALSEGAEAWANQVEYYTIPLAVRQRVMLSDLTSCYFDTFLAKWKSAYYKMVMDLRLPIPGLMSQVHVGSFKKVEFAVFAVVADVHVEEQSG
jgi:hypothetical protein